ncbi:hypothetical protein D3C75_1104380 [compost metagenome]
MRSTIGLHLERFLLTYHSFLNPHDVLCGAFMIDRSGAITQYVSYDMTGWFSAQISNPAPKFSASCLRNLDFWLEKQRKEGVLKVGFKRTSLNDVRAAKGEPFLILK